MYVKMMQTSSQSSQLTAPVCTQPVNNLIL